MILVFALIIEGFLWVLQFYLPFLTQRSIQSPVLSKSGISRSNNNRKTNVFRYCNWFFGQTTTENPTYYGTVTDLSAVIDYHRGKKNIHKNNCDWFVGQVAIDKYTYFGAVSGLSVKRKTNVFWYCNWFVGQTTPETQAYFGTVDLSAKQPLKNPPISIQ